MSDDVKFYEQAIWQYYDKSNSSNVFVVSSLFSKDQWGISPTRLKFSVNNYKNRSFNSVTLDHQGVFLYLARFKPINDVFAKLKAEIEANNNIKKGFVVEAKKNIRTTTMFTPEYGICQRITISDDVETFYDTEKVFIPHLSYLSLVKVLVDFRDSYLSMSMNSQTIIALNEMTAKIDSLNDKLTTLRAEINTRPPVINEVQLELGGAKEMPEPDNPSVDVADAKEDDVLVMDEEGTFRPEPPKEKPSTDLDLDLSLDSDLSLDGTTQNELDTFLENPDFGGKTPAVDTIIDKIDKVDVQKKSVTVKKSVDDCFTSRFLDGDILNLENVITNLVSDKMPLDNFTNLLARKLEIDKAELFPGCDEKQYWQMVYLTTRYCKKYLNCHLNQNQSLPSSVSPLRYNCQKSSKLNKSIMHDLLLYFIYYTLLKNQLQGRDGNSTANKNMACFILKAVLSPFVFSHFNSISTKDVLVSEINARYDQYKKLGVFKRLEEQVHGKYGYDINISNESISQTIKQLHTVLCKNPERFWIKDFFMSRHNDKIVRFDYEAFEKHDLGKEQIEKIINLEANYARNGHIDFGSLSFDQSDIMKLPTDVLKVFDIEEKTYNNKNLSRYITEAMVEDNYQKLALSIADQINESYHDLVGKSFDFVNLPEDVLKMFCIWDLRVDKKLSANYNYMKQKIEDSSLDKASALSMLSDIEPKDEISFTASLSMAI
jgi:hypothetical protein